MIARTLQAVITLILMGIGWAVRDMWHLAYLYQTQGYGLNPTIAYTAAPVLVFVGIIAVWMLSTDK